MKKENIFKLKFNKQSIIELSATHLGEIYGGANTQGSDYQTSNSNRTITTETSTNCNSHSK